MEKVDITITLYFEITGAELYGGEIGYAEQRLDFETADLGSIKVLELAEKSIKNFAELCKVPEENVRIISRDEYNNETCDD